MYPTRSHQTTVTAKDSTLPVNLAEAKDHLRLLSDDLDAEVQSTLEAAIEFCEGSAGRSLRLTHTLVQKYCSWPCGKVALDRQPAKAISSVTYYDTAGTSQTVSSTLYRLQASTHAAGYLEWDSDFTFPGLDFRDDAVAITYTAGYAATEIPAIAKHAIKLKLSLLWGDIDERKVAATERSFDDCLEQLGWGCYR